jgi:hypothetical protein
MRRSDNLYDAQQGPQSSESGDSPSDLNGVGRQVEGRGVARQVLVPSVKPKPPQEGDEAQEDDEIRGDVAGIAQSRPTAKNPFHVPSRKHDGTHDDLW